MAEASSTFDLVVRLSERSNRAATAQALAPLLGAETLLLFVRDPALAALVPAPGFPQTLRGGPAWRAFLSRCAVAGRHSGTVDLPAGDLRPALALASDGVAALAIGGKPVESELATLERLLPMLSVTLAAEQQVLVAAAEAADARSAAGQARALAKALEAARADASRLNAELQQEHRRKDDFLAMLAHELRNPLAPLLTSVDVLRQCGNDAGMAQRQLDVMSRQLLQLSRLVDDLLDVSRVSHGKIDLQRERLLLEDLLTESLQESRTLLEARRHVVEASFGEEPVAVLADRVRLFQVFANLIHNAAKYTDPGGRLAIRACREGSEAVVRITDNGIGISPEMLPRVFDLFAQANGSIDRAQGGLGVGLTLVRSLVELHGGSVAAESGGTGQGSSFVVRLPLAPAATPGERPAAIAAAPSAAARPLNVLVVDDNQDAADSMALTLRLMGHHAQTAYSGLAALQAAADLDADLILLDIGLPEIDGHEVGRRLRRIAPRNAWFVALTGYGSDEDRRRSREAGFDEHALKPLTADALKSILSRAAARRLRSGGNQATRGV